jgi:hypothetical protein
MAMKNCYIKLDELYSRVKRAEEIGNQTEIQVLENEYSIILQNIENHTEFDYLCLRYNLRNRKDTTLEEFKKSDMISYWIKKILNTISIVLFFTLPLILSFIGGNNWAYVCFK